MSEHEFQENARLYAAGLISRRRFIRRLVAGGLSVVGATALVTATRTTLDTKPALGQIYGTPPTTVGATPTTAATATTIAARGTAGPATATGGDGGSARGGDGGRGGSGTTPVCNQNTNGASWEETVQVVDEDGQVVDEYVVVHEAEPSLNCDAGGRGGSGGDAGTSRGGEGGVAFSAG